METGHQHKKFLSGHAQQGAHAMSFISINFIIGANNFHQDMFDPHGY
jgi:hypothetical protein